VSFICILSLFLSLSLSLPMISRPLSLSPYMHTRVHVCIPGQLHGRTITRRRLLLGEVLFRLRLTTRRWLDTCLVRNSRVSAVEYEARSGREQCLILADREREKEGETWCVGLSQKRQGETARAHRCPSVTVYETSRVARQTDREREREKSRVSVAARDKNK